MDRQNWPFIVHRFTPRCFRMRFYSVDILFLFWFLFSVDHTVNVWISRGEENNNGSTPLDWFSFHVVSHAILVLDYGLQCRNRLQMNDLRFFIVNIRFDAIQFRMNFWKIHETNDAKWHWNALNFEANRSELYCRITFHNEWLDEQERKKRVTKSVIFRARRLSSVDRWNKRPRQIENVKKMQAFLTYFNVNLSFLAKSEIIYLTKNTEPKERNYYRSIEIHYLPFFFFIASYFVLADIARFKVFSYRFRSTIC